MNFRNRAQAAELLAEKLVHYAREHPLILGIPRGAVPMAQILADRLKGDLDIVLVHKIGAPDHPEYAIGSVSEFGSLYRTPAFDFYQASARFIKKVISDEIDRLQQKRKMYSPIRPPLNPSSRTVIIVDDGIATGATMVSAVRAIRLQDPAKIVVASPVASQEAAELIGAEVDDLVLLDTPEFFFSVSQFYEEFPQVSDDEVCAILGKTNRRVAA